MGGHGYVPRLGDLSEYLREKENYHVCVECYAEHDLRKLSCNDHLECGDCIDKQISQARSTGTQFTCPTCHKRCFGNSRSDFPLDLQVQETNKKFHRQKELLEGDGYANSEEAKRALEESLAETFRQHKADVGLMKDPEVRRMAFQETDTILGKVKDMLKKIWEGIKGFIRYVGRSIMNFFKDLFN